MADEALALETVADRAGFPGRWQQALLALGVGVAWLAALESISRGSAWWLGLMALLGVAAVAARARMALAPVRIDAGVFHHAGIRVPLAGARVARLAWVGAEGRIGTALEVTNGRRVLRAGVRGATRLSCERATRHVDAVVASPAAFEALMRRLDDGVAERASTYRERAPSEWARSLWAVPMPAPGSWPAAVGMGLVVASARDWADSLGPERTAIALAAIVTVVAIREAWRRPRGEERIQYRRLIADGRSVWLEVDGRELWRTREGARGARLGRQGELAALILEPWPGHVLRVAAAAPSLRGEYEVGDVDCRISGEDFEWLVGHLGLVGPRMPPTRVEVEDEVEGEDQGEPPRRAKAG